MCGGGAGWVGGVDRGEVSREIPVDLRQAEEAVQQLAEQRRGTAVALDQRQLDQEGLGLGTFGDGPADRVAFGVIGVEQAGWRPAPEVRGQLPAEVHRVLEAGVESLGADGEVDVRGVAA